MHCTEIIHRNYDCDLITKNLMDPLPLKSVCSKQNLNALELQYMSKYNFSYSEFTNIHCRNIGLNILIT